ncbi:lysozyme inhibitor LprI family protein [Spirosoma aerophilum]
MKTCTCFLIGLFLIVATASFGQTQSAINNAQGQTLQQADKTLNTVYQKVLKQYSTDPEFIKNLKIAQRIWVQFRDAEVKMKYPDRPVGEYGSAQPMCEATYRTQLTQQRTKTLSIWLTGIEEGDVCAGSVKIKD